MMIGGVKTLDELELENKRVLLRLDLNLDVRKGKVIESERLTAPLITLKELKRKKARIVIMAHQGRPGSEDFTSLKQHAKLLNKRLKVKFVEDVIGSKAQKAIKSLKAGEILLLDNIRSVPSEMDYKGGDNVLVNTLAPFFDVYVNDAFSASHRMHASIVGFPTKLSSGIGRIFERELVAVQKLNIENALLILGGVKPEDYFDLVEATKGKVLPTGYLAILAHKAQGLTLGKEDEIIKDHLSVVPLIKKNQNRFIMPLDEAVETKEGKRLNIMLDEFPSPYPIYDLGEKTIKLYLSEIKKAQSIFIKGLPGMCHTSAFTIGTEKLLRAIASSKAFSVMGGGHTLTIMEQLKIPQKKFDYISLSGGALMHYLAHKTLPALEAMQS